MKKKKDVKKDVKKPATRSVKCDMFIYKPFQDDVKRIAKNAGQEKLTAAESLFFIACHPETPREILVKLSIHNDIRIRRAVASHLQTPIDTLDYLSGDADDGVRYQLVKNPNTSITTLDRFSTDLNRNVRYYLGWNPNTSRAALRILCNDSDEDIVSSAAHHSNCSLEMLISLMQCSDRIRSAVASNPNISLDMMWQFSKSTDRCTLYNVIANPNITEEILEELREHSIPQVKRRAEDVLEKIRSHVKLSINQPGWFKKMYNKFMELWYKCTLILFG